MFGAASNWLLGFESTSPPPFLWYAGAGTESWWSATDDWRFKPSTRDTRDDCDFNGGEQCHRSWPPPPPLLSLLLSSSSKLQHPYFVGPRAWRRWSRKSLSKAPPLEKPSSMSSPECAMLHSRRRLETSDGRPGTDPLDSAPLPFFSLSASACDGSLPVAALGKCITRALRAYL